MRGIRSTGCSPPRDRDHPLGRCRCSCTERRLRGGCCARWPCSGNQVRAHLLSCRIGGLPGPHRLECAAAGDVRRVMTTLATISFPAIGTTAELTLTDDGWIDEAEALMRRRLHDIDRAASRFRPDSEIVLVEAMRGPRRVSALLSGAIHTALAAARETGGLVDPTARP